MQRELDRLLALKPTVAAGRHLRDAMFLDARDKLLTFLSRRDIEPTNNASEQALRPTAARSWQSETGGKRIDISRLRKTVDRAFEPATLDNMIGKSVLWVDDNPANNALAVRALKKFRLDVEEATSTEAAMGAFRRRKFDLVISDMGRGEDMRAGYTLLKRLRDSGGKIPFFIFAGSDKPEFRREAAERGAQPSTNDMLELADNVVRYLGTEP